MLFFFLPVNVVGFDNSLNWNLNVISSDGICIFPIKSVSQFHRHAFFVEKKLGMQPKANFSILLNYRLIAIARFNHQAFFLFSITSCETDNDCSTNLNCFSAILNTNKTAIDCIIAFATKWCLIGAYALPQYFKNFFGSCHGDGTRAVKCLVANMNAENGTNVNGWRSPNANCPATAFACRLRESGSVLVNKLAWV